MVIIHLKIKLPIVINQRENTDNVLTIKLDNRSIIFTPISKLTAHY